MLAIGIEYFSVRLGGLNNDVHVIAFSSRLGPFPQQPPDMLLDGPSRRVLHVTRLVVARLHLVLPSLAYLLAKAH